MPLELACFFIEFLTDDGDLVLDPFAGSNTTGFGAELLHRKWIAIEIDEAYVEQSSVRFEDPCVNAPRENQEANYGNDRDNSEVSTS